MQKLDASDGGEINHDVLLHNAILKTLGMGYYWGVTETGWVAISNVLRNIVEYLILNIHY